MSCHNFQLPEKAFLLGVTTLKPLERNEGYASATAWLLVLSTTITFPGASARYSIVWEIVGSGLERQGSGGNVYGCIIGVVEGLVDDGDVDESQTVGGLVFGHPGELLEEDGSNAASAY